MKFKQYLREGRTEDVEIDNAVDLILKNCMKNFKSIYMAGKTIPIYRGVLNGSHGTGFIDTNSGKPRESRNTYNYMTLLMDNLPSWSKYPKRSRGIICSTDENKASGYGSMYHIIPYDDAKIAICSERDLWFSFYKAFGSNITVFSFNSWMFGLLNKYNLETNDSDWSQFKRMLEELDKKLKEEEDSGSWLMGSKFDLYHPKKSVLDILNKDLAPIRNGFKLGIKNIQPKREVWIQGKAITVEEQYVDGIIEKVIDQM